MDKYIMLDNYLTQIDEVDIIVYVHPDGGEMKDHPLKRYSFPMEYLESNNTWGFDLEAYKLLDYQILYKFRINQQFTINQMNSDYEIVQDELLSVRHPHTTVVSYERDVEVKSLYTYSTYANKVNRKISFLASESKVELSVQLSNQSNVLVQVEWLNPTSNICFITEHTVEAEQEFHSYIIMQQDDELRYGQWTVSLYTSGQKLSSTSFIVTMHDKYRFQHYTSSFDRLL